jgi:hypothetical protein
MSTITNTSNLINIAYPIAGQDNDSQGFRDNFNNINESFITASEEITDLQSKALLVTPLIGTTSTNNDFAGAVVKNIVLQGERVQTVNYLLTPVGGVVTIDPTAGTYQKYSVSSATSFVVSWPKNSLNILNKLTLELSKDSTLTNVTVTFVPPQGGAIKTDSNVGLSLPLNITQAAPAISLYEIFTTDGGFTSYLRYLGGPFT